MAASAAALGNLPELVEMTAQFHTPSRHAANAIARRVHDDHPEAQLAVRRSRSLRPGSGWTVHARLPNMRISLEGIQRIGDHLAELADQNDADWDWQALRPKVAQRRRGRSGLDG
jgi:hypothetical protein